MVRISFCLALICAAGAWGPAAHAQCGDHEGHMALAAAADSEIPDAEVTADVPALNDLHDVVFELWHDAYPEKNTALIKELLPRADALTAKLDEAELPGILRDRQAQWDQGREKLKSSLEALHQAADADDDEAILEKTEAFHSAFEFLVRTIHPMVDELDAFHQELYKLYHYYAPDYDLAKIREAAAVMQEKIPPLKEATLRKSLAERQKAFDAAVAELGSAVDELVKTAKKDDRDAVLAAVETVHTRYQKTEKIFD